MPTEFADIFKALAAPFPKDQERSRNQGGMTLTYITARAVMNRFDEVAGPENWWPRYEETKDGIRCAVTLRLPDGREVTKEDGGGFATTMKDEDNVEKSGFSDALKRAGVVWGVGRYLYKDGVPRFEGTATAAKPAPPRPASSTMTGPIGKPAPPTPAYGDWLAGYCEEKNAMWLREIAGIPASVKAPAEIVSTYQLNRHLLKALSIATGPKELDNIKAGAGAWADNREAMEAEARAYCRKLWKEAKAKLTPSRDPGGDDDLPSPDEEAALDRMAGAAK